MGIYPTRGNSINMGNRLIARNLCHTDYKYFKNEILKTVFNGISHVERGPKFQHLPQHILRITKPCTYIVCPELLKTPSHLKLKPHHR